MRIVTGILVWVAIATIGIWNIRQVTSEPTKAATQLTMYLTASRRVVELDFDASYSVQVGDPILLATGERSQVVGVIQRVESAESIATGIVRTQHAFAEFYAVAPALNESNYLTYHATPDSMEWVVETMLPPDVRLEIGQMIGEAFSQHQTEIVTQFQPVIQAAYLEASAIVKEEFLVSVEARDEQIQKLGRRFQTELVDYRIVPLVKSEIWPIIDSEGRPLVTKIGLKIWNEASIWRFGWRIFYDQLPLTDQNLAQKEFENFVQTKASPIIESHLNEIIVVQKRILTEISRNPKVQDVASDSLKLIVRDPEFQILVADIFKDIFVDNERLKKVLEKHWSSPEAQQAMAITNRKLEPTITRIGQTMFGAPDSEITPGFKRVLRNRIMQKDKRWFVLHQPGSESSSGDEQVSSLNVIRGVDSER